MAKGLHSKKEAHVLLKLDISKAFDLVAWPFSLGGLPHLGFGCHWYNLLCLLLSTAPTQILVNGDPSTRASSRGSFVYDAVYIGYFTHLLGHSVGISATSLNGGACAAPYLCLC